MKDTSIFQGVVEFDADGEALRFTAQGSGIHAVHVKNGSGYAFERNVRVRGRGKPTTYRLLSALRHARGDYNEVD